MRPRMAILSSRPPSKPVQAHVRIGYNQFSSHVRTDNANPDTATSNNEHSRCELFDVVCESCQLSSKTHLIISLCLPLLISCRDRLTLIIKLLTFGKAYLHFAKALLEVHLQRNDRVTFLGKLP